MGKRWTLDLLQVGSKRSWNITLFWECISLSMSGLKFQQRFKFKWSGWNWQVKVTRTCSLTIISKWKGNGILVKWQTDRRTDYRQNTMHYLEPTVQGAQVGSKIPYVPMKFASKPIHGGPVHLLPYPIWEWSFLSPFHKPSKPQQETLFSFLMESFVVIKSIIDGNEINRLSVCLPIYEWVINH